MIQALTKHLYELLVILKPNLTDDELEKNITQLETAIKNYGGTIVKIDDPSKKRFTHKVKNLKEGFYISIIFSAPPELPNTLKKTLSIADDVLRYIVIRKEGNSK